MLSFTLVCVCARAQTQEEELQQTLEPLAAPTSSRTIEPYGTTEHRTSSIERQDGTPSLRTNALRKRRLSIDVKEYRRMRLEEQSVGAATTALLLMPCAKQPSRAKATNQPSSGFCPADAAALRTPHSARICPSVRPSVVRPFIALNEDVVVLNHVRCCCWSPTPMRQWQ